MKKYNLDTKDIVMIDDMKHGIEMANKMNIDTIGAGWAHRIPEIENYMKNNTTFYCKDITKLKEYIFKD